MDVYIPVPRNRVEANKAFIAQERIRLHEDYREAILSWLRANNIDPTHVPAGVRPTIADDQITIVMYTLNDKGQRQFDINDADQLASHTVTVPLLVPPTPEVQLWLAPRCETCGR